MLHCEKGMDSLQSVLPRAISELFRQGPLSQAKLEAAWRLAVGDALNRVSTPYLRDDGSVDVKTADPRWGRELKRASHVILGKLNGLLGAGTIKTLHVG